jgi:hypothetical protein
MKLQLLKYLQSINILFVLSLIIVGCSNSVKTEKVYDKYNRPLHISSGSDEYLVSEWEYKEHTYIIISRTYGGGITHAGHCKCYINGGTGRDTLVRTLR